MLEIPGYRLLRQLGRGGMATVYLAVQESVAREVALKVMSPALLVDADFGARFQREARIAAHLHHRHVVGIHDVGRVDDHHYIAMEYLSGGSLLDRDGAPRPVPFALRAIREIADALDYAQAKGFIHRDVKPDNILLREDGSAVLTDFGIARASDPMSRLTRTGVVVGTPHYMSPEQARGKELDGRCDIYSLGIVLYELLVGCVPYHADDSLAVGIMHITQPIPMLPDSLAALQPLLSRMLAKDVGERFQTGAEVVEAIAAIERRIADGELPELRGVPRDHVHGELATATQVSLPVAPARIDGASRAEPGLGRIDDIGSLDDMPRPRGKRSGNDTGRGSGLAARRRTARRPRKRVVPILIAALVLMVAAAAAWTWQDELRGLLPQTELNDTLVRAERALDAGRIDGDQGDSAAELFEAARDMQPDSERARRGIVMVGQKLLDRARLSLRAGDRKTAAQQLERARALLGGGSDVDAIAEELKRSNAAQTAASALLERGEAALAAGNIMGTQGAAALYRQILEADPGNALAVTGLTKCADALAAQVRSALDAHDRATATARIGDIAAIASTYPALPELRGVLAKAREADEAKLDALLARAASQLRAGHVSGGEESAVALYALAQKLDPQNAKVRAGMTAVAHALVGQARAAIEDSRTEHAAHLLSEARAIDPQLADLRAATTSLRDLREQLASDGARPLLTDEDQRRVQILVEQAKQAEEAGNIIVPPGRCAYDKYRSALAIDGSSAAALAGLASLPARARVLFDTAIADKTPFRARVLLDAIRQLAPGDVMISDMSSRLADAFLDEAQAQLTADRRGEAVRALQAARELSPANPRLRAIEAATRLGPDG